MSRWTLAMVLIVTAAVSAPAVAGGGYVANIGVISVIFVILGASFNLIFGMTGYLSMSHAASFGIGAYAAALASTRFGWDFLPNLLFGAALSALVAFIFGAFVFRRVRGFPFAIVTLGMTLTLWVVANHWVDLTRGPLGIPGITRPVIAGISFSNSIAYFYLGIVLAGCVVGLCALIARSDAGRALRAIRENEAMAATLGLDTYWYKLSAYVAASAFASLSGVYYAHYLSVVSPDVFFLYWITTPIVIVHIAGLGHLRAVVAVAVVLVVVPELLRASQAYQQLLFGITLVASVTLLPEGVAGWIRRGVVVK
jgi:branched-chain amino acid transport system permease protein